MSLAPISRRKCSSPSRSGERPSRPPAIRSFTAARSAFGSARSASHSSIQRTAQPRAPPAKRSTASTACTFGAPWLPARRARQPLPARQHQRRRAQCSVQWREAPSRASRSPATALRARPTSRPAAASVHPCRPGHDLSEYERLVASSCRYSPSRATDDAEAQVPTRHANRAGPGVWPPRARPAQPSKRSDCDRRRACARRAARGSSRRRRPLHAAAIGLEVVEGKVVDLGKQLASVQQGKDLLLVPPDQPLVDRLVVLCPAILHAVLLGEALDLAVAEHR